MLGEKPKIPHHKQGTKGKVTAKFSFRFIQECVPFIVAAALVWAFSSIYFGIVFLFPVDMPTLVIIVIGMVGSWIGVIITARKGNQFLALVLLFLVSALSGLAGAIHPLMIRVPIGCVIIIGLWWIWGYWIRSIENHSAAVVGLILLGILVDLAIYWLILTVVFQENWIDWTLYLIEAIFVYSAMVYESFHVREKDIADNRMWVVFKAILAMFIAFIIIAVIIAILFIAGVGGDISFNVGGGDFSFSRSKKKKALQVPTPGTVAPP